MKICFLELMPIPYKIGGGTTHILTLADQYVKKGHETHIISSKPAKEYTQLKYNKKIKIHNVGMRHRKFKKSIFYYLYRAFFELSFVFQATRLLRKIKPDIIDCQSPITTALPASFNRFPFVISCHGVHTKGFSKLYEMKKASFVSKFLISPYRWFEKYNIKRARELISQGHETLDHYTSLPGVKAKGKIIQNLVDSEFWKPKGKRKDNYIVVVARFSKQKALDKLVLAMKKLPDFKLR
jgi:glycosyltransferase involved in cell wall biosynthesis